MGVAVLLKRPCAHALHDPWVQHQLQCELGERRNMQSYAHVVLRWRVSSVSHAYKRNALRQVHADFENIGRAASLSTVCLYGGSPYGPQEGVLRRGCDVVVGTPGRVKDHLERGTLKLQELQ